MEKESGVFAAFNFSNQMKQALLMGDTETAEEFGQKIRDKYAAMKTAWALYGDQPIQLSNQNIAWCCAQLTA